MLDAEIKDKVREIQHEFCGASVETKLYWAIKRTIDSQIDNIGECEDCLEKKPLNESGYCEECVKEEGILD